MTKRKELENWIVNYLHAIAKLDFELFAMKVLVDEIGLTQEEFDAIVRKVTLTTEGTLHELGEPLMIPLKKICDPLKKTEDRN
jgi:hypothetical protein